MGELSIFGLPRGASTRRIGYRPGDLSVRRSIVKKSLRSDRGREPSREPRRGIPFPEAHDTVPAVEGHDFIVKGPGRRVYPVVREPLVLDLDDSTPLFRFARQKA